MTAIGAMVRREVPPEEVRDHARRLSPRFDELWVVEDLPFSGGVSQLTAVLEATESIPIGHGIAPTPFRNPVALAMEWANLARMYPGRLVAGIGHGVQAWMSQIGGAVDSPLTLLEEQVVAIQTLLRGGTLTMEGRYVEIRDVTLEFPPGRPVPIHAGVTGPRSLQLSGRIADGTVLSEGFGPVEVREAMRLINAGRAAAGRSDAHRLTVFCGFHHGNKADVRSGFDLSRWCSIHDDPAGIVADLISLAATGVDSVVLVPLGTEPITDLERAATDVVPALRRALGEHVIRIRLTDRVLGQTSGDTRRR